MILHQIDVEFIGHLNFQAEMTLQLLLKGCNGGGRLDLQVFQRCIDFCCGFSVQAGDGKLSISMLVAFKYPQSESKVVFEFFLDRFDFLVGSNRKVARLEFVEEIG